MQKYIAFLMGGLCLLTACANPTVAAPVTVVDAQKSCGEIESDIIETGQLKNAARADDGFQWRYIFVVNAFTSAYRINKAEKAAVERLKELNTIAAAKGCLGGQQPVSEPEL